MKQFGADQPRQRTVWAVGAWVTAVSARPVMALGLLALVVLLALAGTSRLSVDTDSSRMLGPDLPFQQRAHALNAAFPTLKNTLVVVVRADSSDTADAAVSALLKTMSRRDDIFDWVFAPSADPYLVAHGLLYLDRDALDGRLSRLGKSANLLANSKVVTLDGVPATGLAVVDGGRVIFDLPDSPVEGAHVLAVAAGAIPASHGQRPLQVQLSRLTGRVELPVPIVASVPVPVAIEVLQDLPHPLDGGIDLDLGSHTVRSSGHWLTLSP